MQDGERIMGRSPSRRRRPWSRRRAARARPRSWGSASRTVSAPCSRESCDRRS